MTTFRMKSAIAPVALVFALGLAACGNGEADTERPAAEAEHEEGEEGHAEGEAEHAEGEEAGERVTIPAASAEASGIGVSTAGPGAIQETLNLTGRIMLQPAARAEVHAPIPAQCARSRAILAMLYAAARLWRASRAPRACRSIRSPPRLRALCWSARPTLAMSPVKIRSLWSATSRAYKLN
ncbi:MAG: hypothetical protein M0D54_02260 [Hyphomonadaceae bacterium JAD_PAG50586_4]|nr:MAG: hypothetical protein M0D54_02260 [Hyphomonadaceae bacterium JAD_PAG50586_4]